jgi:MoaA/NifB/PqqE/SkfB family radical SAM enzyme
MSKPILLHYYITNRCNAACSFCSIWKESPKRDADPLDISNNLRDARAAGCKFVDFTGGEPLLHPLLPQFLHEAKKLGCITSVTTNCICFPKRAHELRGLIDLLHFSIDADNKVIHNTIRGSDSFDSVWESIPIALGNDMVPDLLFTYTNENISAFDGVYKRARAYNLLIILDPVFSLNGTDIVSGKTHAQARKYAKKKGVYLNTAHITLRSRGGNDITHSVCKAVDSTIVILPDNTLALPCYHHAQEFLSLKSSLSQVLTNQQRQYARAEQGRYLFCKGCHINCYFDPSFTYAPNRFFLQSLRTKISYAFTKYIVYKRRSPFFRR